jgi:hypothetical protein
MTIPELETALRLAQARQAKATKAFVPKHRGGEWEEWSEARDALLKAERDLAAANGEQYAVRAEFPVAGDVGAPLPHLLKNDYRTFLVFLLREINPNWNGIPEIRYASSALAQKSLLLRSKGVFAQKWALRMTKCGMATRFMEKALKATAL